MGDWGRLEGGFSNLLVFFEESLWPPDWSVLEARSYPVCEAYFEFQCSVAWIGMVETIKIAFVATIIGFIVALPLSVLADCCCVTARSFMSTASKCGTLRTLNECYLC